jgi:crossover junction endodeoxyribonuclease RuvC
MIHSENGRLHHVAHGTILTNAKDCLSDRLACLYRALKEVIEFHVPQEAAVEETFVNKNPASALKLGLARGIVLLAPAYYGLKVGEYSANHVKKAVVGVGHANKEQVALMVRRFLPQSGEVRLDAADALAVAICHAHHQETQKRWKKPSPD